MKSSVAIKKAGLLATAVGTAGITAIVQSLLCLAYVAILTFTTHGTTKQTQWIELPTLTLRNRALSASFLLASIAVPYLLLVPVRRFWTDARRFSPVAMGFLGSLGTFGGFVVSGWASALAVVPLLTSKYAAPLGLIVPIVATVGGAVGSFAASLAGTLVARRSRTAGAEETRPPRATDTSSSGTFPNLASASSRRSDAGEGNEWPPEPPGASLSRRPPAAGPAMTRFLRSLAVGGLLAFGVVGFMDALPWAIQNPLLMVAFVGAAVAGAYVPISGLTFLSGCLLAVFTVASFPFVRSRQGQASGGWRWRALQTGAFLACVGLFTAAFRHAGTSVARHPWSSPLASFGQAYALAGVIAGILWRSPGIVLPSLVLSVALGALSSPPLLSLDLPQPSGSGGARLVALLSLAGLTWITAPLAGATAWLLSRSITPKRASATGDEPPARETPTKPSTGREAPRAAWRGVAAGVAVVAALSIIALELRALWWPSSVPPWGGARRFVEPSLAPLFAPDRPFRSFSFFETKDNQAMFVAELRDAPPSSYERHYLELLRSRGVFIRAWGGSAHSPRPIDSYQFIVLEQGVGSDRGWSVRYREFWDRRPEMPEGSFWWPIARWRPYPNPVQRRGNAIWVRLGNVRRVVRGETWPLPERDEIEGPELPLPRFPGAIIRDWGPETEDDDILSPSGLLDVRRHYVVRGETPEKVLAHYERALREFGMTPGPYKGERHAVEWWGKEPFKGVVRVAVSTGAPGLVFGRPLDRPGESDAAAALFPRLEELVEVRVSFRLQRLEDAVALWPDADRRRRDLLVAAADGRLAGPVAPAPIAPAMAMLGWGLVAPAHQFFRDTLHEAVRLVEPSRVSVGLLGEHRVLVIPTGGLSELSAQADFVARLGQFVNAGGVVVVFSQMRGSDYDALPMPRGERLRAIGYLADRSVYRRGVRVDQAHPILASLTEGEATINVDGEFTEVPASGRVLLRKAKNEHAALVVYPVGRGWVVASSICDDCLSCQLPGPGNPEVVRDIFAWAREPADLPWHTAGSALVLAVPIAHRGVTVSASVVLRLLSPSRDRVLAEATLPHALAPRRDGVVKWALRVPEDAPRGIHHVSYTLLDAKGQVVQSAVESPVARLVVGEPVRPKKP